MQKVFIRPVLLILFYTSSLIASDDSFYGSLPSVLSQVEIVDNIGYKAAYSDSLKLPLWVAYKLIADTVYTVEERPGRFSEDIRTNARVNHSDYTNSGYDRGHMAPNYAVATCYGRRAQIETFLMSNICPQKPNLNRGSWKNLEMWIAKEALKSCGTLWVITGPIIPPGFSHLVSGVAIPNAFYKIIIDEMDCEVRTLAFIISQDVSRNEAFQSHLVSIDSIEAVTGIDFFQDLGVSIEVLLEQKVTSKIWK